MSLGYLLYIIIEILLINPLNYIIYQYTILLYILTISIRMYKVSVNNPIAGIKKNIRLDFTNLT